MQEMREGSQMTSNVYITQATQHDLAPCSKFGSPTFLLKSFRDATNDPQAVLEELRTLLKDFSDDDYLLLIGDPVAISLAVSAAAEANDGRVRLLKWSKKHQDYFPISVQLFETN